jgi:hypothetical protein
VLPGANPYLCAVSLLSRVRYAVALRNRQGLDLCDDTTVLNALHSSIRAEVIQQLSTRPVAAEQQIALVEEVAQMVTQDLAPFYRHSVWAGCC